MLRRDFENLQEIGQCCADIQRWALNAAGGEMELSPRCDDIIQTANRIIERAKIIKSAPST